MLTCLALMAGLAVTCAASAAPQKHDPVLTSFDLQGVAEYIQAGKARNIVVMCGAGISVSAGIPDFRTPGTGEALCSGRQRHSWQDATLAMLQAC